MNRSRMRECFVRKIGTRYLFPSAIAVLLMLIIIEYVRSDGDTICGATSMSKVYNANPFATNAPLLDNLDKFRGLPVCDPLRKILIPKRIAPTGTSSSSTHEHESTKTESMKKKIPAFTAMAAQHENSGPLSVLHSMHVQRQRVRVMVRYVDCIRGGVDRICVGL